MKLFSPVLSKDDLKQLDNNVLYLGDMVSSDVINQYTTLSTPKYIINDHWVTIELREHEIYSLPIWLANVVEKFKPDDFPQCGNQYSFNFMVNKKQINRYLCIKLVEMFELTDYTYTWSGLGREFDLSEIIKELNSLGTASPLTDKQRSFLLAPIEIPENYLHGTGTNDDNVSRAYQGIVWTWNNIFKSAFSNCATSLITESVRYERGSVFTEKTAYPVLALNFPIWIGGYKQASDWKRLGFDIFEDIIDHSYETRSTLIERCYYAVANNLELLKNKQFAHELREKHMDRLIANRNLLLNDQLIDVCKTMVNSWPKDLQKIAPEFYSRFPTIHHLF